MYGARRAVKWRKKGARHKKWHKRGCCVKKLVAPRRCGGGWGRLQGSRETLLCLVVVNEGCFCAKELRGQSCCAKERVAPKLSEELSLLRQTKDAVRSFAHEVILLQTEENFDFDPKQNLMCSKRV